MGEDKNKNKNSFDSFKEWFEDHKLRAVGNILSPTLLINIFFYVLVYLIHKRCLWLSGMAASIAYNWSKPEKTSVKIIHAR
ncbi:hypothetical protein RHGRI_012578 [Rhododendron griersonianum]|uniref:Uncharacterized protein n=1 Tax=Rhododendron griersonianum TaxID=479676 RepID=A0AAV6KRK2_9ERIC|nr:hypothetical protein RHGRI_012578 [Rhododendron griersonianum]